MSNLADHEKECEKRYGEIKAEFKGVLTRLEHIEEAQKHQYSKIDTLSQRTSWMLGGIAVLTLISPYIADYLTRV